MCGIFGFISKKSKPFNKRAFCTMGVRNDSRGGDSCGIFIDGLTEYGVDKQKLFINFFRDSILLDTVTECKVALGHCRKASVGKVDIKTAQPVVIGSKENAVDFVLIHNGTIYNYQELAKKYIPEVDIEGLTDSQVMALIFYYKGYDCLDEYNGGAVFVIHDYRVNKSYVFKGASKKYTYAKEELEERPLYYCWHNGRFCFSSIFETLYSFYYEEPIYNFPTNKLMVVRGDKLKLVKEYKREKCTQTKPTQTSSVYYMDDIDKHYGYGAYHTDSVNRSYRLKHDGITYMNDKNEPIHGKFFVSNYGYIFPNKKVKETWLHEVAFFQGRLLRHPKAFDLIDKYYQEANKVITDKIEILINMLDFNPHSDDLYQFYWYDGGTLMVPQGEWKWPMLEMSFILDNKGKVTDAGRSQYWGWTTDYAMYVYDEETILNDWKKLCGEE